MAIEPVGVYPLLQSIVSLLCEVTVVSGTAHDDFRLLCNATHLVSSGAGKFMMAAALFSRDSRIFHCTAFSIQTEHLNPRLINPNQVAVKMQVMKGFRQQWHHGQ